MNKKIITNTFYNLIATVLNLISRFGASIIAARMLGPTEMGTYSLVIFTFGTLEMITNLGLGNLAIKYISEFTGTDNESIRKKIFIYVIKTKLIVTACAAIILIGIADSFAQFFLNSDLKLYVIFVAITLLPSGIASIIHNVIQGIQNYRILTTRCAIIAPIYILSVFLVLNQGYGIEGLMWVGLGIAISDVFIYYLLIRKYLSLENNSSDPLPAEIRRRIYNYNWQLAVIVFLDTIVWQKSEVFFLGRLSTADEVAFYSIAYNFASWSIAFLPSVFTGVLFPIISELYGNDDKISIGKIYLESTRYILILILPVCVCGLILSGKMVNIIYGAEYLPMVSVLNILFISTFVSIVVSPGSSILYSTENQGFIIKVGLCISVLNIALNVILIPHYGAFGAAISNASAQLCGAAIGTYKVCKLFETRLHLREMLKVTSCAILMYLAMYLLARVDEGIFGQIACIIFGIAIYIISIHKLNIIHDKDMRLFQQTAFLLSEKYNTLYDKVKKVMPRCT